MIDIWKKNQRYYLNKGLIFLFSNQNSSNKDWGCFIVKGDYHSKKTMVDTITFMRKELKNAFESNTNTLTNVTWNQMDKNYKNFCFEIPFEQLIDVDPADQNKLLARIYHIRLFPFISFFQSIEKISHTSQDYNQLAIDYQWEFIQHYIQFLQSQLKGLASTQKKTLTWFSMYMDVSQFEKSLPSIQLNTILLFLIEQNILDRNISIITKQLISVAHDEVQTFFKQNRRFIEDLISEKITTYNKNAIKKEYAITSSSDENIIDFQYALNYPNYWESENSPFLRQKERTIKDLLSKNSILDKIKNTTTKNGQKYRPFFFKHYDFAINGSQKWYDYTKSDRSQFQSGKPRQLRQRENNIKNTQLATHIQQLNRFTAPILQWKLVNNKCIPVWRFSDTSNTYQLLIALKKDQEEYKKQKLELHSNIKTLKTLQSSEKIIKFKSKTTKFTNFDLQEIWEVEFQLQLTKINQKEKNQLKKLFEYGIATEQDKKLTKKKLIWLEEMMQIEKEVGPYISFVKQAYMSALPINKRVVFDDSRHTYDGVEFDPSTINDQQKWIRADVMKSMKYKIERGEIEQINCFCLDLSYSMDHHKMRNLFKILYLLISGLEDRKSYDAIHFFSNNFIEGVNFTADYTNKKILFQVLKKISKITWDELKYQGIEGTNISDGINKSVVKIIEFNQAFKIENPEINTVYSLFVITDGVPSLGIVDHDLLGEHIENKREDNNITIKGIYLKPEDEKENWMNIVFGENNYVETSSFEDAVHQFVSIITETYKKQRQDFRWKRKQERLNKKHEKQ